MPLKRFLVARFHRLDAHMKELVHGAVIAFAVKVGGAVVTVLLNIALARLLGPSASGLYFLALSVLTVAAVVGRLGLDDSLLRFIASHAAIDDWPSVRGVFRLGIRMGAAGCTIAGLAVFGLAPVLATHAFHKPELVSALRWTAVAVVPTGLLNLEAESLKGLKQILRSQLVQGVFVPAGALALMLLLAPRFGLTGALAAYVTASLAAAAVGAIWWRRALSARRHSPPAFQMRRLLTSSIPSYWVSSTNLIMTWTATIAMGIWRPSAEVAQFSIAVRMALLIGFILLAINSMVAPQFASLYHRGELKALGKLARQSTILMTTLAAPLLLVFLVAPSAIVRLFGDGFAPAIPLLPIIAIGQFVNVATGAVGYLLMMSGNERLLRNSHIVGATVSIVLNCTLVPRYGAMGAAIATAATLSIVNLISAGLVLWRLSILTIPFPVRLLPLRLRRVVC